jgi:FPG/IleRS zinc finger protein
VYQRAGEPCPRCGRPVRRVVVGGRATHFCSWCQRLSPADRLGAAAILRGMVPRAGRRPGTRGPRWTELPGVDLGERAARTRKAAATRRAAARASAGTAAGA